MPSMKFFHRRVASTHDTPPRLKDDVIAASVSSTKTSSTVSTLTDFGDEHREDSERSIEDLELSDDEDDDDWRTDFLSPGSAISNDIEGRKTKSLSPVPSGDAQDSEASNTSSRTEPSSASQTSTIETPLHPSIEGSVQDWVEPLKPPSPPGPVDDVPPSPVRPTTATDDVRAEDCFRHHRHRSMTSVAAHDILPRNDHRVSSLSPGKPPTHRRSSSMTARLPASPRSPLSACLSLESLYSTLQLRTRSFGPCDRQVGQIWNLIGNYHFRHHQFEKAIKAYESTLKCTEGSTEKEHIAAAYSNIGTVCWSTGDIKRSIVCMEKALELRIEAETLKGRDREQSLRIASSYYQLGLALSLDREYDEALDALTRALRIKEMAVGRGSADVARTLDAIGKIHIFRGEADDAMSCYQEAYSIKRVSSGEHGPGITSSLMNIATAHVARKDYKEAIFCCLAARSAQSVEIRRASNEGSPSLVRMLEEAGETSQLLVDLFTKTGNFRNAQLAVNESLQLYQQAGLREDHPRMHALKESVKLLQKSAM